MEIAVGRCIVSDIRIIIKRWRKLECITRVPPKIMLKIIVTRNRENLLKMLVMDQIQILIRSLCDRKKLLQKMKTDTSEKNAFYEAGANVRMLERKVSQAEEKNCNVV